MKRIYFLLLIIAVASGCRKFVEIDQNTSRTLTYTSDYRALLDNNSTMESGFGQVIYSNDDTRILDVSKQNTLSDINQNVYTWQAKYLSEIQGDVDWENLYKVIYTANEVIAGVMDSQRGSTELKETVRAEALVHRAYSYWCLVNIYAKQFDSTTAATDPGVPLLTTPNLFVPLVRASVQQVYNQIIEDLTAAEPHLLDVADFNTRPSKAAVYALLARTHLFTRNFSQAKLYAEKALSIKNELLDLRTYETNASAIPRRLQDPQIIFSKKQAGNYDGIQLDTALLSLLGTNDLRYKLFVKPGGSFSPAFTGFGYWRHRYTFEGIYQGPSVPEMMLVKAEVEARSGNAATAIGILNELRKKRFSTTTYTDLPVGAAAEALNAVVQERRREFFGTGLRWFDQKRLNKDAALQVTVTRSFKGNNYALTPNSDRYVYPIGDKYILLNPELKQNP